jgi:hypothetical protein
MRYQVVRQESNYSTGMTHILVDIDGIPDKVAFTISDYIMQSAEGLQSWLRQKVESYHEDWMQEQKILAKGK